MIEQQIFWGSFCFIVVYGALGVLGYFVFDIIKKRFDL